MGRSVVPGGMKDGSGNDWGFFSMFLNKAKSGLRDS